MEHVNRTLEWVRGPHGGVDMVELTPEALVRLKELPEQGLGKEYRDEL